MLLALDFAGDLVEALSQPFRLTFEMAIGPGDHIPDFLAVTRAGSWLIDVPSGRADQGGGPGAVRGPAEVALSCGWRYAVVPGWRPHVQATLDTVSAQRRPLTDPLGLQAVLLATAYEGPVRFGELVERTEVPAMARAEALHLLWHRRLGVDLTAPLNDQSMVHAGRGIR